MDGLAEYPGGVCWTGKARLFTVDKVRTPNVDDLCDAIADDGEGPHEDPALRESDAAAQSDFRAMVGAWIERHKLLVTWYAVEEMEHHKART